ncbi:lipase/acyltransferase domain-containing protein [Undibacterium sp. Ji67W]|uniref:lipase/acyltransferase domain-containing protein n=1 Tax=Undibacterium sp. Ji67W TaxID=3413042 RepID=UPI003BF19E1B
MLKADIRIQNTVRKLLLLFISSLLFACASTPRPDLSRLYRISDQTKDNTPVILIPGLFGSKLRDKQTGKEVWPGSATDVLFSNYQQLALKFDHQTLQVLPDNLEAYDVADSVLGQDIYGPIISTLEKSGGYHRGIPGKAALKGERHYYVFPYDFRQDNSRHALALEAMIDQIRRDYGNPDLKVDLVAHSMGGLVARYYLRYGVADVLNGEHEQVTLDGTTRVRKLILLGTPNLGSVSSLHAFLSGETVGFGKISPEVLATMPSGYQLFPHPLVSWLIDANGNTLNDNLFDVATWERYRWSIFNPTIQQRMFKSGGAMAGDSLADLQRFFSYRLERARRFMWALSTPEPETPIRYVLFGGDCNMTPARLLLESDGDQLMTRLNPTAIHHPIAGVRYDELMLEPGDGRVTKPSFLARESLDPSTEQSEDSFIPVAYWFFLCEDHVQLTNNINFQDNLLNVLLTRSLPWENAPSQMKTK